jgi:gamma-glutamyltranspeptidase / glutathione hydrolase
MKKLLLIMLALVLAAPAAHPVAAPDDGVSSKDGLVVCTSAPACDAGAAVLAKGGSAVDAAVATAFALAVTLPSAGNIGGGGFMVVHPPQGAPTVFDYRETAPQAAHPMMFKKDESWYTHRASGVPGTVRGMALAHRKFGKRSWAAVVRPAVALAEKGFVLDAHHATSLNKVLAEAKDHAELQRVFGKPGGGTWAAGDRLVQPDLARTLALIAEQGPDAFYTGPIADQLAAEMKAGGGLITKEDLATYRAEQRDPVHGTYRGYDVYAPPPPSSGGTCLAEMLNVLETYDLKQHPRFSPETLHLMIEAMRRAYCDRARFLGDPAFTKIPAHLTTKEYARELARGIDPMKATPSETLAADLPLTAEGDSTTHFSIIDKDGLAVANTYTLERSYGSRVVVRGAGFLLNNEMGDFNWRPGVTTKSGTIGTAPNQIAPGKRMLSSQTPTILAKNGKVVYVTGSPGGRTIINTVLGIVVSVVDYGMPLQDAVNAPRLHHQWFPDEVRMESPKDLPETVARLRQMGHRVVASPKQGDAHSIWINPATGGYVGAADRRLSGAVAGY